MNPQGYFTLVLHAHLPYVRHPEHPEFLEERWLFEALTESYLPLLALMDGWLADEVDFRLAVGLTPTLVSMLEDHLLRERYLQYLDRLIRLTEQELTRLRYHTNFGPTARFYKARLESVRANFKDRLQGDVVGQFRRLQELGCVEILTSSATHAYLPHLRHIPSAVRSQIAVGVETYRKHFGRQPTGFWLPECAYFPGLDQVLADEGVLYTILESHGIAQGSRRPQFGTYAPIVCPSGVAAFGRDTETSRLVWSSEVGYPGDPDYRDFYRDIGFDRPPEDIARALGPDGVNSFTGLKYHRVTGSTPHKLPYDRERAMRRVDIHAADFVARLTRAIANVAPDMDRRPILLSPYDAELFGHWWFEGPEWLDRVVRKIDALETPTVVTATPSEYLAENPRAQESVPAESSWGRGGFHDVWLNHSNDEIYPRLHGMARTMESLALQHEDANGLERQILNMAGKESLLAQSSDWTFLQRAGTATTYASRRLAEHLERFDQLAGFLDPANMVDEDTVREQLELIEGRSGLFPWLQYEVFSESIEDSGVEASASRSSAAASSSVQRVVFLSAEAVPFSKAGGLGDVAGALPGALAGLGVHVDLVLPLHGTLDREKFSVRTLREDVVAWFDGVEEHFDLLEARSSNDNVRVLLIDHPTYFGRQGVYVDPKTGYEYADGAERYLFFCRAALEALRTLGDRVDVLHCHDHQTALALALRRLQYSRDPVFAESVGVFTIHNLGYQGIYDATILDLVGIEPEWFYPTSPFEFYGQVNLMKIGLILADKVNAVSEKYAREICEDPLVGARLEGVLKDRGSDLVGILNGIDVDEWDPETDPHLPAKFSVDDLAGKRDNKELLIRRVGLDPEHLVGTPLVGMVSRLVGQKGLDLIEEGLDDMMALGIDLVVLGTGEARYHEFLEAAAKLYPGRIAVQLKFDNGLAHLIEAGSDMFLMPSLYEPCGLNQMYSLRYGTVPVVRATGGLADTVPDDDMTAGGGLGFSFLAYTPEALIESLGRAVAAYQDATRWREIMTRGMKLDCSWERSAGKYLELYEDALERRRQGTTNP
jgi:1,4-alpha-glucan branching enzyme